MNDEQEKDVMLEMCKGQGYVPQGCTLPGMLVFTLVNKGEKPCDGCNTDRSKCGGSPKSAKRGD